MMAERLYVFLFALLISTIPGASQAQDFPPRGEKPDPAAMYSKIDADSDGCVTLSEFQNHRPSGASMGKRSEGSPPEMGNREEFFDRLDTDNDGALSKEEFLSIKRK